MLNAKIINAASREAEIYIYEDIGEGYYSGMSAKRFSEELKALGDLDKITVNINSLGGDVFDGLAIYNELKNHPAKVTTIVNGVAASAASIIAMAGREIVMSEGSFLMIHRAWSFVLGNAAELRKTADDLEKIDGQLAEIYARRSGSSVEDITAQMDAETWFTADEAVAAGLADKAIKTETAQPDMAAAYGERLIAAYKKVPSALLAAMSAKRDQPTPPKAITGQEAEEPGELPASPDGANRAARLRVLDLAIKNRRD